MKHQNKFNLSVITREADSFLMAQIGEDEPVWAALIDHIFNPPKNVQKWWLEIERLPGQQGYRIAVIVPGDNGPVQSSVLYLTPPGSAPTFDLGGHWGPAE